MSAKPKILIICSIGQGKNFLTFDDHWNLIVEAQCCSEKLESDSIPLTPNPNFSQELAWEVTKQELQQLRSSRTPLKLIFYALKEGQRRELGHIPLDIRTLKELPPPPDPTWRKLLVPHKIAKETKSGPLPPQVSISLYSETVGQVNNKCDNILTAQLDETNGFFQIGKHASCRKLYLLSVTILSATNLAKLIPSDSQLESDEFSFYYEMMGNKVYSDKFWNIVDPRFAPERASLRIRSSLPMLKRYFQQVWSSIELSLLCGDKKVLAQGKVSLSEFAATKLTFESCKTATLSTDCFLSNSSIGHDEDKPSVRVTISLRADEEEVQESPPQPSMKIPEPEAVTCGAPVVIDPPKSNERRHFSCTINISSIHPNFSGKIYMRYDYMFFGGGIPFSTMPAIPVEADKSAGITNGTCSYDFATTWNNLMDTFKQVPLRLELWVVEGHGEICGRLHDACDVSLSELVKPAIPVQIKNTAGTVGERRFCSLQVQTGMKNKIQINLSLDDWGVLKDSGMSLRNEGPTKNLERQATIELELWRAKKEEEHEKELAKLKTNYLAQLTEEWKTRHGEREALVKRKVDEYDKLRTELRTTLTQLTQKESDLNKREQKLKLDKAQFDAMMAHHESETRGKLKQTQMDHQSHLQKEQNLRRNLECEISSLRAKFAEIEASTKNNGKIYNLNEETSKTLERLAMERDEWHRRFEEEQKTKNHYKQSWVKALNELAALRSAREAEMVEQLRKKDIKLKKLESQKSMAAHAHHFAASKADLDNLKAQIAVKQLETETKGDKFIKSQNELIGNQKSSKYEDHVARLIEERDSLLRTGVYSNEDKIIAELDREIRETVRNHNLGHFVC